MTADNSTAASPPLDLNCTEDYFPPLSQDYYDVLTDGEKAGIVVCGVLTLINLLILIDNIVFFYRNLSQVRTVLFTALWLVALCPTLSVISLMALLIPRMSLLRQFVMMACVSIVMYKFLQHIKAFSRHSGLNEKVLNQEIRFNVPPCCCCCPCLPKRRISRFMIRVLKFLVLQCAVVSLIITGITLCLWLDEKFVAGKLSADNAFPYLAVVRLTSTLVAIYALSVLYGNLEPKFVESSYARQKYTALKLTLLAVNVQGIIFDIMEISGVWDDRKCVKAKIFANYSEDVTFIVEIFFIALLNLWSYRRPISLDTMKADLEAAEQQEQQVQPEEHQSPAKSVSSDYSQNNASFVGNEDGVVEGYRENNEVSNEGNPDNVNNISSNENSPTHVANGNVNVSFVDAASTKI